MASTAALRQYKGKLTNYEQSEILDYREVFFLGQDVQKTKVTRSVADNYGLDNERGDYALVKHDHIAYRYEILGILGKGSFGQVVKAFDHKRKIQVAVKIIRNKRRFHTAAKQEIRILNYLQQRDKEGRYNIIALRNTFLFRNHVCLVFDLLHDNLYQLLKANKFKGLGLNLIRRFAIQLLQSLRLMKRCSIIHCDLKPENVLLRHAKRSAIRVIDLGSACFANKPLFTYIQSRFYRAPEIMLGLKYTSAIDMWSFGCILAELYLGRPLFPGENVAEQMQRLMEMLGVPAEHLIRKASNIHRFFDGNDTPILTPNTKGKIRTPGARTLVSFLQCPDHKFVDLVSKCLMWDASERITPDEAIRHEWIQEALTAKQQQNGTAQLSETMKPAPLKTQLRLTRLTPSDTTAAPSSLPSSGKNVTAKEFLF